MIAGGVNYNDATTYLNKAKGHVKSAILMALTGLNLTDAKHLLTQNDGFIKKAVLKWEKS